MKNIQDMSIDGCTIGQEMSLITFREFVEELLQSPFEEVYKDYLIHGANYYEKSNME
jgi:hypothetical protein